MAYDEGLAERLREVMAAPGVSEKKMFGGLAFLIGGNMAVAASGQGGVLVRVDPEESDELVASTEAHPMEMRGREMRGWLRVDADVVRLPQRQRLVCVLSEKDVAAPAAKQALHAFQD